MSTNSTERKLPMRRCTGCGEHFPKNTLIRILRTPEGEVVLDTTGKRSGRGAYICKKVSCLSKARRSGRITSALEVQIPEEVFAKMEEELAVGR